MAGEISTSQTFADGDQITSAKLNNIISQASFTDNAVTGDTLMQTGGKLKVKTITSAELGADAVTSPAILDGAVTAVKILDGNVTTEKLADLSVTAAKLANGTITFAKLSTGAAATENVMKNETASYLVTPDVVKHSLRVAKAHGVVELGVGTRTLKTNSLNITSVAADTATGTRVILATDMGAANYTVLASWESTTGDAQAIGVYGKTAGGFYIVHPTAAANKFLNFVCFGPY